MEKCVYENQHQTCILFDDVGGEKMTREEELLFNFNRALSKKILDRRKELGITQEELARRSGVSRLTISAIEKKRRVISVEVLLKLLDALRLKMYFTE